MRAVKKKNRSKTHSLEMNGGESKLGHHAYQHLKQMLLHGELAAGDKISEVRLATELGMSRTPVREAIRRLEVDGMLQSMASSGTFVKKAERSTIIEVYELRIAIECFAVQKATRLMKPAQVKQLQELCDQMLTAIRSFRDSGASCMKGDLLQRYLNVDIGFHLMLLKAAGNSLALNIYNDFNLRSAIFGCRSHDRDLHHLAWVWRHHARVARAVRQRNAQAALQALESHMQASMKAALEVYDASLAGRTTTVTQADYTEDVVALMAGHQ